jgi:hypothetical protein
MYMRNQGHRKGKADSLAGSKVLSPMQMPYCQLEEQQLSQQSLIPSACAVVCCSRNICSERVEAVPLAGL